VVPPAGPGCPWLLLAAPGCLTSFLQNNHAQIPFQNIALLLFRSEI
jgi:hypothetical protein